MVGKFSLYDFIAVVIPGIFSIWVAKVLTGAATLQRIFAPRMQQFEKIAMIWH